MKKLVVFIILTIMFCLLGSNITQKLTIENIFSNSDAEVYIEGETTTGYLSIKNGTGSIIYCKANDIPYISSKSNVLGFTIKIENMCLKDIFRKIDVFDVKKLDGYYYGKSSLLKKQVTLKDASVNFQCATNDDYVLLGCPILLGSY